MSVVVVIHPADHPDGLAQALRSVTRHPDAEVELFLAPGPAGGSASTQDWVAGLELPHPVHWLPAGPAGAAWAAAAAASGRADLLLLDAASEGRGWAATLEALQTDTTVATATALTNNGGLVSVPNRNLAHPLLPPGTDLEAATRAVAEAGAIGGVAAQPAIPIALPHCCAIARAALDVAGPFDADLGAHDALAAFSARCAEAGLRHVVAGGAFVLHHGPPAPALAQQVRTRHPWLQQAIQDAAEDRSSALARLLLATARALRPRSVTLDARGLVGEVTGTKVHVAALVRELAARDDVSLRLLVPDAGLSAHARAVLGDLEDVTLLPAAHAADAGRTDVVHRPHGLDDADELALLDALGERIVLTQHDLIGFHMPSAFADAEGWRAHRRAVTLGLEAAAAVLVPSGHVEQDLRRQGCNDPRRVRVVPNGTDPVGPPAAPQAPQGVPDAPFLLVLGGTLAHKQRPFALDLLRALRDDHGWDGHLVLAGAQAPSGGTAGPEARRLLEHPDLAGRVHDLGVVDEAVKAWLYEGAAAVLAPSTVEGFGLTPFEAARHGCPALVAPVASLRELLGDELTLLVAWDATASAAAVLPVLTDPARRTALAAQIAARGQALTWSAAAEQVVEAYELACRLPFPPGAVAAAQAAAAEARYWHLRDGLDEHAHALVGPDDPLLDRRERHLLAEVARSPRGRKLLAAFLRSARRAG